MTSALASHDESAFAGLRVRDLRRTDIRAVAEIEADRHPVDAWRAATFHEALDHVPERSVCRVITTEDGTDVVAYGIVSLAADVADLDNLTVRRDHERQGIGRWLLDHLLRTAAASGAVEMLLEVRHDNSPAIALYQSAGFFELSRRRNYYATGLDAIVMRRALEGRSGVDG
jgi:ribosomal-protein-alanine N-acetyltransferase